MTAKTCKTLGCSRLSLRTKKWKKFTQTIKIPPIPSRPYRTRIVLHRLSKYHSPNRTRSTWKRLNLFPRRWNFKPHFKAPVLNRSLGLQSRNSWGIWTPSVPLWQRKSKSQLFCSTSSSAGICSTRKPKCRPYTWSLMKPSMNCWKRHSSFMTGIALIQNQCHPMGGSASTRVKWAYGWAN